MAVDFKEIVKVKILDVPADEFAGKLDVPFEVAVWVKEIVKRHYTKSCTSLMLFQRRYEDRISEQFKPIEDKTKEEHGEKHDEQTEPAGDSLFVEGD